MFITVTESLHLTSCTALWEIPADTATVVKLVGKTPNFRVLKSDCWFGPELVLWLDHSGPDPRSGPHSKLMDHCSPTGLVPPLLVTPVTSSKLISLVRVLRLRVVNSYHLPRVKRLLSSVAASGVTNQGDGWWSKKEGDT